MEKFDVIIVGAGLAGLAAAYSLASKGIEALVVERGDYPGAKSVTGGRLYLNPVKPFFPEIWREAPLERLISKEVLTFVGEISSASIQLLSGRFGRKPYHSFTILRSKFDRWLSEKAKEKGAIIITKNKVDDLIWENGNIAGAVVAGDKIQADVVLAADGAMSLVAQKAGLRSKHNPEDFAIGIKEVIELPSKTIEERFNLSNNEGAAQLFVGSLTKGIFGAGFLYTNIDSLSLGTVVRIKDLMQKKPPVEVWKLMEEIKQRPEINNLIKGGNSIEYAAHLIPEGGIKLMPGLYSDGILVAGDAAGFAMNMGITVRGMEFALVSGALAAQAINRAKERNDFSARGLSIYQDLLQESFVLQDLSTFKHMPGFLENPRLFALYPQLACELLEELMFIDAKPKEKLSTTVRKKISKKIKGTERLLILNDVRKALKI